MNQINGLNSLGKSTLTMLESLQPPPVEAVLTPLINEIAASSGKIAFILDDNHLIENQAIHEILSFLIENQPPQFHLVITTREDPQLPLARLRAKDQLTELRAADLRFTPPEAAEFLNEIMGLVLSEEDITALEIRTEGWITGLQLAALSMQKRRDVSTFVKSFTGSHKLVLDAVNVGEPPGTVVELAKDDIPLFRGIKMSDHQITFQEVLGLAKIRDKFPEHLHLIGAQPADLSIGVGLSPTIEAVIPELVERTICVLKNWGIIPAEGKQNEYRSYNLYNTT